MRRERDHAPAPVCLPPATLVEATGSSVVLEHPEAGGRRPGVRKRAQRFIVKPAGDAAAPLLREDVQAVQPALLRRRDSDDPVAALRDDDVFALVGDRLPQRSRIASSGNGKRSGG